MKLGTLQELLIEEIKDLYSAENQLLKALPKMAKAAADFTLKAAFEEHLEETRVQVDRLFTISEQLNFSPKGKKCKAMEGLIEEGSDVIDAKGDASVKDAALICAAQKVEHYEMAGYGCARTFAQLLGLSEVAELLQETLDEEGNADKKLTEIAKAAINVEASTAAQ
jgi:ferritin-like metal-binding protein YciE